jgi:hypothetical protein
VAVARQHHSKQHLQRRDSLDRPDKMARKGSPDNRDNRECRGKRGIQARLVIGGTQATPDDRVTRVIQEIQDKRATLAIKASPVHAPTDSITLLILTEGYTAWKTNQ